MSTISGTGGTVQIGDMCVAHVKEWSFEYSIPVEGNEPVPFSTIVESVSMLCEFQSIRAPWSHGNARQRRQWRRVARARDVKL